MLRGWREVPASGVGDSQSLDSTELETWLGELVSMKEEEEGLRLGGAT